MAHDKPFRYCKAGKQEYRGKIDFDLRLVQHQMACQYLLQLTMVCVCVRVCPRTCLPYPAKVTDLQMQLLKPSFSSWLTNCSQVPCITAWTCPAPATLSIVSASSRICGSMAPPRVEMFTQLLPHDKAPSPCAPRSHLFLTSGIGLGRMRGPGGQREVPP